MCVPYLLQSKSKKMRIYIKTLNRVALAMLIVLPFASHAQTAETKAWVARSNNYTKMLLDIDKKYSPEFGSQQGLIIYDEQIGVPTLANSLAAQKEKERVVAILKGARQTEPDRFVKQDLDILITKTQLAIKQANYFQQKTWSPL